MSDRVKPRESQIKGVNLPSFAEDRFASSSDKEISNLIMANSVCSLRKGLDEYLRETKDNSNYKYAIIHVAQSIELLLKSKIAEHDKGLIRTSKARSRRLKTIGLKNSLQILGDKLKVEIAPNDVEALKDCRCFRNEIEHFAFLGNKDVFDQLLSYLVSFYWAFLLENMPKVVFRSLLCKSQFDLALKFESIWQKAYIAGKERLQKVFDECAPGERLISIGFCESCDCDTLLIDEDRHACKCYMCGVEPKDLPAYLRHPGDSNEQ